MLDKILPLQEAFMASEKSREDMWRFLDSLSQIIEEKEEETNCILGVFVFFDGIELPYEWDGARFGISSYTMDVDTGFSIYINNAENDTYHSLHNETLSATPYHKGYVVYYNTGWKTSIDVPIGIYNEYIDAFTFLNNLQKNPEWNYYIH